MQFPHLSLELGPHMRQDEFVAVTSRLNRDNLGCNGGWQRHSVRALIPEDRRLGIFVIFFDGLLGKASFAWSQKDESWDTWTEGGEAARQKEYQQELDFKLGGVTAFSRGRVDATLDSKSGGTDIWIDYKVTSPC
jgi:hypothetical protein